MTYPREYADDDALFDELKRVLGPPPGVDQHLLDAAKAVYTWRTVDAELAALAYDSAPEPFPGVRSEVAAVRTLTFECCALIVELGVTATSLVGELVPPQAGAITIRQLGHPSARVTVDDLGCFRICPAPAGPFSLHVRTTGDLDVVTNWVIL